MIQILIFEWCSENVENFVYCDRVGGVVVDGIAVIDMV